MDQITPVDIQNIMIGRYVIFGVLAAISLALVIYVIVQVTRRVRGTGDFLPDVLDEDAAKTTVHRDSALSDKAIKSLEVDESMDVTTLISPAPEPEYVLPDLTEVDSPPVPVDPNSVIQEVTDDAKPEQAAESDGEEITIELVEDTAGMSRSAAIPESAAEDGAEVIVVDPKGELDGMKMEIIEDLGGEHAPVEKTMPTEITKPDLTQKDEKAETVDKIRAAIEGKQKPNERDST